MRIAAELLQLGVRRSNVPEDHSSKSVEPTSRSDRAMPNQAPETRGRLRDWMASIPLG